MTKYAAFSLSILFVFLFHGINTLAQPTAPPVPPAVAPAPPTLAPAKSATPPASPAKPPTQSAKAPAQSVQVPVQKGSIDVTKILVKARGYSVFIRLLKSTGLAAQLYGQLNSSNNGFTIFAPTDTAFSNLKPGTINSLSDLQKTQLIQFHILNSVIGLSNFQTLSNPVPTEAGDTSAGEFPLNVTTAGNQVNISTGLVNTTVGGTIYLDNQLAIYRVDSVLLPLDVFSPKAKKAAAPKPAISESNTTATTADSPSGDGAAAASAAASAAGAAASAAADAAKIFASDAVSLSRKGMLLPFGIVAVAFCMAKGT
ncbi:fasciclin-like arabinogalactan protein 12 [Juglans microcarpa x Juglans regia]|uniref:fasciclin-like arabinogalactan protein 12 n=1 Tax=Juglans microcarpa x Juglans regia TaxID=2249226 RepID=UPI001B7EC4A2|nr:fasciclin-like arabinogalactan protein 12 [Juglans microcarpa x Juglans regia]